MLCEDRVTNFHEGYIFSWSLESTCFTMTRGILPGHRGKHLQQIQGCKDANAVDSHCLQGKWVGGEWAVLRVGIVISGTFPVCFVCTHSSVRRCAEEVLSHPPVPSHLLTRKHICPRQICTANMPSETLYFTGTARGFGMGWDWMALSGSQEISFWCHGMHLSASV